MIKRSIIVERITLRFNHFIGTSHALLIALMVIAIWAVSYSYNLKWHSNIVELITMLGFLNIFIVQRAQNKDLKAIHLKLDELLASSQRASNLLIKAEEAPEHILEQVQDIYKDLAKVSKDDQPRQSITSQAVDLIMEEAHNHNKLVELDIEEQIVNIVPKNRSKT